MDRNTRVEPPPRVKGVPAQAFWAGGPDGGNWYVITRADSIRRQAVIQVYHDGTGELLVSRTFLMDCINEKGVDWQNLQNQINFFDGNSVVLMIKGKFKSGKYCYLK